MDYKYVYQGGRSGDRARRVTLRSEAGLAKALRPWLVTGLPEAAVKEGTQGQAPDSIKGMTTGRRPCTGASRRTAEVDHPGLVINLKMDFSTYTKSHIETWGEQIRSHMETSLAELTYISRVQFLLVSWIIRLPLGMFRRQHSPVAMVLGCHGESCVCVCVGKACASKLFYWFCSDVQFVIMGKGGILLGLTDDKFVIMGKYFTASQSCQVERMFGE